MLKTLRITSLIAVVLAGVGVVLIVVTGLRADGDIVSLLDRPGIAELFKDAGDTGEDKNKAETPLVTQSREFALRIDPPPPPKPKEAPKPKDPPKPKETVVREPPKPKPTPPRPKAPVNAKFTLLATVRCATNPAKSLALLQTSSTKQEWFWQGQRVGHLDVEEVRDGSVIFSQNGRNQQELFVPVKTEAKSILAQDNLSEKPRPAGPGSINVRLDPEGGSSSAEGAGGTDATSPVPTATTESGAIRMARPRTPTTRASASERIQRARTVPKPPTPEEQKADIQSNVSRIQEIMSDEETIGLSDEEKAAQKESWQQLIQLLQAEKEILDKNQGNQPAGKEAPAEAAPAKPEAPKEDLTRKRPAAPKEEE